MVCDYWFFNNEFKFPDSVCNGCHDLTMLCVKITENAFITVKSANYRCIIHGISKPKAITLLKMSVLKIVGIFENAYARLNLQLF